MNNRFLYIGYILMGIMFFFIASSYSKEKDKNWTDWGTSITGFALAVFLFVAGIVNVFKKQN